MILEQRIPKEFYESFVKAQSESENAWEEAKEKADFSIFAPHLQKMIDMTAEMTGYTDPEKEWIPLRWTACLKI